MTLDKILITITGFVGIVFTYWFFLMKKDKELSANGSIDVIVEGGYSPSLISVKKGQKTTLNFLRKDQNQCLEEILFPDFKIKKYLPLNKITPIEIEPQEAGEYGFVCSMNMFHGKVVAK
ncbi:cupredoxin domain-containing protein [Patescibacteria group bacterium]|nr:cupredoxin domain-containing protein [Patescibacteria group bacterium]